MRISSKVEYGIRALLDLAVWGRQGPCLSRDTAQRQGIPETYLNQLLLQLRRSGLLASVRGPRGGHMLARPAEAITMLEIIEALEGPLIVMPEGLALATSTDTDMLIADVWEGLRATMHDYLADITLQDLADRRSSREGELEYQI